MFKLGHNQMSDWTHEEYKAILSYKSIENRNHITSPPQSSANPIARDWRLSGCVNEVYDQKACGCDYAFVLGTQMEFTDCMISDELKQLSK